MHYRDVARKASMLGLMHASGHAAESNINVALNKSPFFSPMGGGYYALAKWGLSMNNTGPLDVDSDTERNDSRLCCCICVCCGVSSLYCRGPALGTVGFARRGLHVLSA